MSKYKWLMPNVNNLLIWMISIIMLLGVLVFNWQAETILITYFFETIIIGFIHIFKLLATFLFSKSASTETGKHKTSDIFQIPFFIFHYFFFIFIQSTFVFMYLSFFIKGIKDDINVLKNYHFLLQQQDMQMAFISLSLFSVAMALKNFFLPKRFLHTNVKKLFMQPYLRIFIQQFVTIIAGFGILIFNMPIALAILLIVTRLVVDLALQEAAKNEEFKKVFVKYLAQSQNEKEIKKVEKQVETFLNE
ncbi:MAG: DUF6498-containing protein [Pedobacter sp.]